MKKFSIIILNLAILTLTNLTFAHSHSEVVKPTPAQALKMLLDGNQRYVDEKPLHSNNSAARRDLAAHQNQGDYAIATILGCSDSRVPVELIFDAGIMDLFVVRIPGNIIDMNNIGSIEYGAHHVNTPIIMLLGHSDCGGVTSSVALATAKEKPQIEENIANLLKSVISVVHEVKIKHPELEGKALIDHCIEENIYNDAYELFLNSPSIREAMVEGKVQVVGAIYDIESGKVNMLDQKIFDSLLDKAEKSSTRKMNVFAE